MSPCGASSRQLWRSAADGAADCVSGRSVLLILHSFSTYSTDSSGMKLSKGNPFYTFTQGSSVFHPKGCILRQEMTLIVNNFL